MLNYKYVFIIQLNYEYFFHHKAKTVIPFMYFLSVIDTTHNVINSQSGERGAELSLDGGGASQYKLAKLN